MKLTFRYLFLAFLLAIALVGTFTLSKNLQTQKIIPFSNAATTDANLKVAFIGDVDVKSSSTAVLQLIKNEQAAMVIHSGDFDYQNNPTQYENLVNANLGANFPYFASVGNHDAAQWNGTSGYQKKFTDRLARIPGASCSGDYGVNSICHYRGLTFVLSGAGTMDQSSGAPSLPPHDQYIQQELAKEPNTTWKVCSWHKNMKAMQPGGKSDEAGWAVYEACRTQGAIIATPHEHSYSRTKTMTSIQSQTVDSSCSDPRNVCVAPGKTFVFVSGSGGASMRDQTLCNSANNQYPYGCSYWASIYTTNQTGGNEKFGALFIVFNYNGNPNKAHGYFKTTDGQIIDEFDITAAGSAGPPPTGTGPTPTIPANCTKKAQGDADCNGLINLSDFETFRREYTGTANTKNADFDSNGSVNLADFETFRRTFTGGGGLTQQPQTPTPTTGAIPTVPVPGGNATATVETTPVDNSGDAADDPAIWVNPSGQSFVLGTDKKGGGILTYTLSGTKVSQAANGLRINNVDVRNGFNLNGQNVSLAVGSDRSGKIARFKINNDGSLTNIAGNNPSISFEPYGSCMYKNMSTGKFYVILTSSGASTVKQYELTANAGKVDATEVNNNFSAITSQSEGCAGDDELGYIYIGEEAKGIWRFGGEPGNNTAPKLIAPVNSQLKADVEGVSIVKTSNTTGYIFSSSQGDSSFVVYKREGNNDFVKKFKVVSGSIDDVTGSDGIDTTTANLGSGFPSGMFATQDNTNDSGNQNFKFVPLQQILGGSALLPPEGFSDDD